MNNSEIHSDGENNTLAKEAKQIERVALYALLINFMLTGIKGVLACFSGSLAVAASAIDSATDSVASLAKKKSFASKKIKIFFDGFTYSIK